MNTIKVSQVIDSGFAVSTDDGQKIHDLLDKNISLEIIVGLDFGEIDILTTAFLNAAIGQLYSKFNGSQIQPYLKLLNVAEEDKILFKKVTDRAKQYFLERKAFEQDSDNTIYGKN